MKPKIIIIDIDGTIANIDHRKHLIMQDSPKWDEFYKACVGDTPIPENIKLIKDDLEAMTAQPVFVTGRSDIVKDETDNWLIEHFFGGKVYPYTMHMRAAGDHREDFEVKKEVCEEALAEDEIVRAYDDRPQVIRMYKDRGLDIVDLGPGVDF